MEATPRTSDSTPEAAARERNHLLDALRGIAVSGVVGYHIWPGAVPGGFLGVDVFFVVSGYLITVGLSADLGASRARTFQRFWIRRARRILPALLVMVTFTCAAAGVLGAMSAVRLREQVASGLSFTTNWHQISTGESYFASLNPPIFQHLWSLAIEEQFYLLWPLLLLVLVRLVPRDRHRWMVVAGLAVASIVAMAVGYSGSADPSRLYFGTDTHGFSLMLGALVALVHRPVAQLASTLLASPRFVLNRAAAVKLSVALALAVLLVAFMSMSDTGAFAYRGGIAAVAAVTGLLVIVLVTVDHQRVARALPLAPLVWLGERSYGLYLWHWPVVVLLAERWAATSGPALVVRGTAMLAISVLLASLSWKYVEKPFLRGIRPSWPERPDRWLVPAMAATVVMAIALHTVVASPTKTVAEGSIAAGEQAILLSQAQDVEPAETAEPTENAGPVETAGPIEPAGTAPAPVDDVPLGQQITLFGDSVAVASAPALLKDMAGIAIRAKVGAQVWDVVDQVKRVRKSGRLRKYVVIALGANGAAPRGTFPSIVNAAGPGHRFVFVTAHAPRSWVRPYNQSVRAFVATHPGCALADWRSASRQVSDLSDGIHPGPRGGGIYAAVIRRAVRNLAAQP